MAKVEFYELETTKELRRVALKINRELSRKFAPAAPTVSLHLSGKEVVYSIGVLPVSGGKKVMEFVEKLVRKNVGSRRGRPAGEPTRQVKTRIRETKYQALIKAARRKGVTPSYMAHTILESHIG